MSALDEVLKKHRGQIIEREERAIRELLDAYAVMMRELRQSIRELEKKIAAARAAGEDISTVWLQRERRLAILIDQVKDQIARFGSTATAITMREQRAAIEIALRQTNETFALLTGVDPASPNVLGTQLDPRVIEDAVGMMGDGSPIIEYYRQNLAPKVAEAIRVEVIKGVATGTDFRTIADRLFRTGQITRSRALAVARTEVNRVRRETTRSIYQDNSDIISGWEWVASKSRRTCPACLAQDGKVYKLDDEFPQHINCRCTLIPVIIGLPRRERTLGRDWFAQQPIAIKEEILGKEAAAAYIRGDITLDDLVGRKPSKEFGKSIYTKSLASALLKKVYNDVGETQNARVRYFDQSAKDVLLELLGRRRISDTRVATLAGALDDSLVQIETDGRAVRFHVHHPDVKTQIRTLLRDSEGALYFYNDEFFKAEGAPRGLGTIAFARQAFQASELGIEYIKTEAIGNYWTAKANEGNGYYTWPRLGYNAQFSPEASRYYESLLDKKRKIRDINDLMRTEDGRRAWRRYGGTTYLVFELDGRSKSMRTLKRYILEKRGIR